MPFRFFHAMALALVLFATASPAAPESKEDHDARMGWFREARFGMFIHWGLYALPAGEWKGRKFGHNVEWIQDMATIPVSEYTALKDQFNPAKYDPEAWVSMAKDAGMKYIIITTKHHDGFCLWDSAQTDWDVGATPYKKDLLKPLAEACAKHGLKLCFYHSIMDWHHPDYGTRKGWRGNAATAAPDMDKYTTYMKAQLDELLGNYGPVGILWFDGEWEDAWTHERGVDLYDYLRAKSPSIIVNNRVDKGRKGMQGFSSEAKFKGDYGTPEQEIPASGLPGVDWEACMTMNNTWGYSAHDQKWKSTEELLRNLIDIASKGGNYLLNVGPTADGEIPGASVARLKEIAAWMKTNGSSISGTSASPLSKPPAWGRCTMRPLDGGNTRLFLHVFQWPADGKLLLPGLANDAIKASLLAAPDAALPVTRENGQLVLTVPTAAPTPPAGVIALDLAGAPRIETCFLRAGNDGVLLLNAEDASLDGVGLKLQPTGNETNIGYWTNAEDSFSFAVAFDKPGAHAAVMRWACPPQSQGSKVEVRLLDKDNAVVSTLPWKVAATGAWAQYKSQPIGVLAVPAPGNYTLRVVALDKKGEAVLNFATLSLQSAQ